MLGRGLLSVGCSGFIIWIEALVFGVEIEMEDSIDCLNGAEKAQDQIEGNRSSSSARHFLGSDVLAFGVFGVVEITYIELPQIKVHTELIEVQPPNAHHSDALQLVSYILRYTVRRARPSTRASSSPAESRPAAHTVPSTSTSMVPHQ